MMWRAIHLLCTIGLLLPAVYTLRAQPPSTPSPTSSSPFAGKKVALYISLKSLQFSDYYYKPISAWLNRSDSLNLRYEEIRLAYAVKLGTYLTHVLTEHLGADSAYFINANPSIATPFMSVYRTGELSPLSPGALPPGADYVLVIEQLDWSGRKQPVVFSYSNKIITDRKFIPEARLMLHGFARTSAGHVTRTLSGLVRFHWERSPNQAHYFAAAPSDAWAEQLIDRLINVALVELAP